MEDKRMYEVALSGSVSAFNALMEEDQLILDRALVTTSFDETPLHIAALRGHLDLARALLNLCPNLATESDSSGRCPLHLASARGHIDIVRELLQVNSDVCGIRDEDGRTPLHLAAMKGRVEVIRELVRCWPESTRETLRSSGETVLHLCVKHNRLEALKLLMEKSVISEDEFVYHGDNHGNTILHLAAALKQVKTIEYLVQIEAVKGQANVKNGDGFTALDILEHNPIMDWKSTEVRVLLLQAAATGGDRRDVNNPIKAVGITDQKSSAAQEPAAASKEPQTGCCSCKSFKERMCGIWNKYLKTDDNWIEVARGNLIMAATLTATVAFQAGLNPPGSVWQLEDEFRNVTSTLNDTTIYGHGSGTSILATLHPDSFTSFLTYNSISFISSVCVILMMISGFPVNNKFCMWALTLATCSTLTFMVFTYAQSLLMLTRDQQISPALTSITYVMFFLVVLALYTLKCVVYLTRILAWTVRKLLHLVNRFVRCWKTITAEPVLVLRKLADENEPHHQTV